VPEESSKLPMSPTVLALFAIMGLNGVGTVANSVNSNGVSAKVEQLQKTMLNDLETRRWVEDGAALSAETRRDVAHLQTELQRAVARTTVQLDQIRSASAVAALSDKERMDRIAMVHTKDQAAVDARMTQMGAYIADILRSAVPAQSIPQSGGPIGSGRIRNIRAGFQIPVTDRPGPKQ